ncbi:Fis family transcriptional regulator [Anaerocolumna cellulosilytica]|uniref:Stage 0 sporulation protein A homolog n=1 Tax=Anaerocolumna cellulosilytica TaxID=433286 RepID=A0A6S6QWJ1_9FIRM|nr:response regulator [Anaerocolumna cellulosilytica]MBB5193800.1 response regulator NasT [Anaerocolumna cellulosilytica]BCJ94984.1 Fis family transcriptional regulator [Anaerocolumna cellulosilytica]
MGKNETSIVIIDDEPITRMDLREMLKGEGYQILGEAADGFDAIELCRQKTPDLVLMDIKMPLLDGLSAAKIIYEENLAGTIILLTAYNEREFVNGAKQNGVSGYLIKPIEETLLIPNIELAVARSMEMRKLKENYEKVSERLENRRIIEQAKGVVMKDRSICEQEAYEYIRKLSQLKNISMKRVSEIILTNAGA